MNEEEITSNLSQHLKAQEVNTEQPGLIETVSIEQPQVEAFHDNLPLDNMILRYETMDFLNIPTGSRQSTETQSQIDTILRWASENAPSKEKSDMLATIHQQIRMMGIQLREDKVQRLYRYVKLNSQRLAVETQMKALNG